LFLLWAADYPTLLQLNGFEPNPKRNQWHALSMKGCYCPRLVAVTYCRWQLVTWL